MSDRCLDCKWWVKLKDSTLGNCCDPEFNKIITFYNSTCFNFKRRSLSDKEEIKE